MYQAIYDAVALADTKLDTLRKALEPLTIKDHIKGHVTFKFYRGGELWYVTETGFEFPVPVDDTGTATFLASDKGILFMRYIRKHLDLLKAKDND